MLEALHPSKQADGTEVQTDGIVKVVLHRGESWRGGKWGGGGGDHENKGGPHGIGLAE